MKRNLFFMYAISFFQGMVFYSSIATLYRQAAGLSGVDTSILYLSCRRECEVSLSLPQAYSYCSLSSDDFSQRAFGIYEGLGTAGLLSAAAIYTVFIEENYRVAGFLTVISYGIAAILSFGLKEVKPAVKDERMSVRHSLTILKETLFNRSLFFLISGVYILMTLSGLVSVFSAPLTKKLKLKFFGATLFVVCSFSCLMLALTENPFVSVVGVLLVRVCFSLMSPLETELQNKAITTIDRATALSMSTLIMDLLAVFTNLIFGKLAEFDLSAAMCFGGFLCILGASLYLNSFKITK